MGSKHLYLQKHQVLTESPELLLCYNSMEQRKLAVRNPSGENAVHCGWGTTLHTFWFNLWRIKSSRHDFLQLQICSLNFFFTSCGGLRPEPGGLLIVRRRPPCLVVRESTLVHGCGSERKERKDTQTTALTTCLKCVNKGLAIRLNRCVLRSSRRQSESPARIIRSLRTEQCLICK